LKFVFVILIETKTSEKDMYQLQPFLAKKKKGKREEEKLHPPCYSLLNSFLVSRNKEKYRPSFYAPTRTHCNGKRFITLWTWCSVESVVRDFTVTNPVSDEREQFFFLF
jgi:hypothetical protein